MPRFLFLLVFIPLGGTAPWSAKAQSTKCRQLLFTSPSGPGELEFQFDQAPQEVRDFFGGRISNGIIQPAEWKKKFLTDSGSAHEALRFFSRLGKKFIHAHELPERHQLMFQEILKISRAQINLLSTRQLLELQNTFAHWNHIPPNSWSFAVQKRWAKLIEGWTSQEFSSFATLRKLSPLPLEPTFQKQFESNLIKKFSTLPRRTQIEVLAGELLNGTHYSSRFWREVFTSTLRSLRESDTNANPPKIGALKDLYRGLLRFRSSQFGAFSPLIGDIEIQIDSYLARSGLSLMTGGTSGYSNNKKSKIDERLMVFESQLFRVLGSQNVRREWMDPSLPGMFDPVDYYFPQYELVIEWDGLHHYLRLLDEQGRSTFEPRSFVLRPMDAAKDVALKHSGIQVLRVAPFMAETTDLDLLKYK